MTNVIVHYRGHNIRRLGETDSASQLSAQEREWIKQLFNVKRGYTIEVLDERDPYNHVGCNA